MDSGHARMKDFETELDIGGKSRPKCSLPVGFQLFFGRGFFYGNLPVIFK
jgi:hypothetical protein